MKSIVDEGVPRDLVKLLRELGCDVHSFPNSWKGTKNGRLLQLVSESGFGCLITSDKNLTSQQNVARAGVAVVVLPHQFLDELKEIREMIVDVVNGAEAGSISYVAKKVD